MEDALRCVCISELSFCAGDTAPVCLVLNNLVRGFLFGGREMNDTEYMRLALELAKKDADGHPQIRWWVLSL